MISTIEFNINDLKCTLETQSNLTKTFSLELTYNGGKCTSELIFGLDRFKDIESVALQVDGSIHLLDSHKRRVLPYKNALLNIRQNDLPDKRGKKFFPYLLTIPLKYDQLTINEDIALSSFDELYVVDTNQARIREKNFFVCRPYKLCLQKEHWSVEPLEDPIFMVSASQFDGEYKNKHEQAAITEFIKWWKKSRILRMPANYRVGIISDKNSSEQYQFEINLGQKPLIANEFLEKPFELIYVSSAQIKKNSHRFCKMFFEMDKHSKAFFRGAEESLGETAIDNLLKELE